MFATTKKVKLSGNKEVLCMDLTYGYLVGLANGTIEDTIVNAIYNATELTEDDVLALRNHELDVLFQAIMQLTYPQSYNEDGTLKELPDEDEGKKKA